MTRQAKHQLPRPVGVFPTSGGPDKERDMESFLSAVSSGGGPLELVDAKSGRVMVPRLEVAADSASRKRGLLGRTHLPIGNGLVIAPTNAIHTFFMKFPIDVAFVARDGRVVKLSKNLRSWRIAVGCGAYAVVELAANSASPAGLEVGARVRVQPCEPR